MNAQHNVAVTGTRRRLSTAALLGFTAAVLSTTAVVTALSPKLPRLVGD